MIAHAYPTLMRQHTQMKSVPYVLEIERNKETMTSFNSFTMTHRLGINIAFDFSFSAGVFLSMYMTIMKSLSVIMITCA